METIYQTDDTGHDAVVNRLESTTFVGLEEVRFAKATIQSAETDRELLNTSLTFESASSRERLSIEVTKHQTKTNAATIKARYTLSPASEAEISQYMDTFSGWATNYPSLQDGHIVEIQFNTDPFKDFEQADELTLRVDYELRGRQIDDRDGLLAVERRLEDGLAASDWAIQTRDSLEVGNNTSAIAPDGSEHNISVKPFNSSVKVSFQRTAALP